MLEDLPECFGVEYIDDSKEECPHEACLVRYDCKQVFGVSFGLRKSNEAPKKSVKKDITSSPTQRKRGYAKPGRLLYRDEGTFRDKLLFEIKEFLEKFNFKIKATKCLHSFLNSKTFVLKIDTRRKNSLLLYVSKDLHVYAEEEGLSSRDIFDSEAPNFPPYLCKVVMVRSLSDVDRFGTAFDSFWENVDDTE